MGIVGSIATVTVSVVIASYLYYGIVHVPDDMDNRDKVRGVYVERKYIRAISIIGEYLGLGNRVVLSRSVSKMLTLQSPAVTIMGVKISDADFGGVRVRIYKPDGLMSNGPAMIWIHGGGWVTKTVENDDELVSEMAGRLDIMIFSIDYRLAPEHPFPAALDDCVTATIYLMEHTNEFEIDKGRIAIAGSSAGGNLAAAVSLKLRDDKLQYKLKHQVLVVPCLQAVDFLTPSYQLNYDDGFLSADWMIHFWMLYGFSYDGNSKLVGIAKNNDHISNEVKEFVKYIDDNLFKKTDIQPSASLDLNKPSPNKIWEKIKNILLNPYFAPLMEKNLYNLPEAYIITAQYDVVRDDGLMYAKRLSQAGNKVTVRNYEHTFHAVLHFFKINTISKKAMDELVAHLAKKL